MAEVQHQHVLGIFELPRALCQLVVAQVLGRRGKAKSGVSASLTSPVFHQAGRSGWALRKGQMRGFRGQKETASILAGGYLGQGSDSMSNLGQGTAYSKPQFPHL